MRAHASGDTLVRLDGVGDVILFGEREYSLRIWLDPQKLSAYGMTSTDVVQALREQNVQVSGGSIGGPPTPSTNAFQYTVTTQGRFSDARQFRYVIVKATADGRLVQLQDIARIELGAKDYVTNSYLNGKPAVALGIFARPGTNALDAAAVDQEDDGNRLSGFPAGPVLRHRLQSDGVHRGVDQRGLQDDCRSRHIGRHRGSRLPAILADGNHPDRRHPGLADRHIRLPARLRLLA